MNPTEREDALFGRRILGALGVAAVLFLGIGGVLAWKAIASVRAVAAKAEAAPPEIDPARLDTAAPGGALVTRAGVAGPGRVVWLGPAHCALGAEPGPSWVAVAGLRDGVRDARVAWIDGRRLEVTLARWDKGWKREARIVEIALSDALLGQIVGDRECTTAVLRALVRNVDVVGLEYVPAASRPLPHGLAPVEPPELRLRGAR